MFKILDGREQFYQWDLNRKLLVQDASITEVHFCNRTEECSLVVEVVDGVANVPNILLQDNFRIKVYGYDGEATKHSATFGVIARSKPADYVYTETEVKRWEDLEGRVLEAIDASGYYIPSISADGYLSFEASKDSLPDAPAPVFIKGDKGDKGEPGDVSQEQLKEVYDYINQYKHIVSITEDVFLPDLDDGIYHIDGSTGATIYFDDMQSEGLQDGLILVSYIEDYMLYHWIAIGRDTAWYDTIYIGNTRHSEDGEWWEATWSEMEKANNKVSVIKDITNSHLYYPTVKAMTEYVDGKTAPKVFEKIATYTVTPDADGNLPNKIIINKDDNGNAFRLSDAYCEVLFGFTVTNSKFYITANGTGSVLGNGSWGFTNTLRKWNFRVDSYGEGNGGLITAPGGSTIANGSYPNANMSTMSGQPIPVGKTVTVADLQFVINTTNSTFIEGSTITLWGVRK